MAGGSVRYVHLSLLPLTTAPVRFVDSVCTLPGHLLEMQTKPSPEALLVRGMEQRETKEKKRVHDRGKDTKETA